jgi:hypothetical protein
MGLLIRRDPELGRLAMATSTRRKFSNQLLIQGARSIHLQGSWTNQPGRFARIHLVARSCRRHLARPEACYVAPAQQQAMQRYIDSADSSEDASTTTEVELDR